MKNNRDTRVRFLKKNRDSPANANMLTLEICFLAIIAITVVVAFFEALTYQLVSARTPLVIIVPLILLIVVQSFRLFQVRKHADIHNTLLKALSGDFPVLNKICAIFSWMAAFLLMILSIGHYAGMLAFTFYMMRLNSEENLKLSLIVSIATTGIVFILFEYGFNVEMYRGLLFRYFAGYSDF